MNKLVMHLTGWSKITVALMENYTEAQVRAEVAHWVGKGYNVFAWEVEN